MQMDDLGSPYFIQRTISAPPRLQTDVRCQVDASDVNDKTSSGASKMGHLRRLDSFMKSVQETFDMSGSSDFETCARRKPTR
jgi:hypothetical protein